MATSVASPAERVTDIPVEQRRHSDTLRDLQHPGLGGAGCHAAQLKCEGDFVPDPGGGECGARILQYDADEAGGIARRCGGAVRPADLQRAGNFPTVNVGEEARDAPQDRGLAGAGGPGNDRD